MEPLIVSAVMVGLIEGAKRLRLPKILIYPGALVLGIALAFLPQIGAVGNTILAGLTLGLISIGLYEGVEKIPVINKVLKRG